MKKYWFVMVAAGMLLAIGACTLISAKNYAEDLAVVTLTSTAPNAIREELTAADELYRGGGFRRRGRLA